MPGWKISIKGIPDAAKPRYEQRHYIGPNSLKDVEIHWIFHWAAVQMSPFMAPIRHHSHLHHLNLKVWRILRIFRRAASKVFFHSIVGDILPLPFFAVTYYHYLCCQHPHRGDYHVHGELLYFLPSDSHSIGGGMTQSPPSPSPSPSLPLLSTLGINWIFDQQPLKCPLSWHWWRRTVFPPPGCMWRIIFRHTAVKMSFQCQSRHQVFIVMLLQWRCTTIILASANILATAEHSEYCIVSCTTKYLSSSASLPGCCWCHCCCCCWCHLPHCRPNILSLLQWRRTTIILAIANILATAEHSEYCIVSCTTIKISPFIMPVVRYRHHPHCHCECIMNMLYSSPSSWQKCPPSWPLAT